MQDQGRREDRVPQTRLHPYRRARVLQHDQNEQERPRQVRDVQDARGRGVRQGDRREEARRRQVRAPHEGAVPDAATGGQPLPRPSARDHGRDIRRLRSRVPAGRPQGERHRQPHGGKVLWPLPRQPAFMREVRGSPSQGLREAEEGQLGLSAGHPGQPSREAGAALCRPRPPGGGAGLGQHLGRLPVPGRHRQSAEISQPRGDACGRALLAYARECRHSPVDSARQGAFHRRTEGQGGLDGL